MSLMFFPAMAPSGGNREHRKGLPLRHQTRLPMPALRYRRRIEFLSAEAFENLQSKLITADREAHAEVMGVKPSPHPLLRLNFDFTA